MSDAKLLIDSDAFLIFVGARALDHILELLGLDRSRCLRLPALPHMIGRSKSIQEKYPPDVRQHALQACLTVTEIVDRPEDEAFQRLIDVEAIDEGEALLYAMLAEHPRYLLTSGDKRSMIALCASPGLRDIRRKVSGRVICIESIVRRFVANDGVDTVFRMFAPIVPAYKTLQVVFSAKNRKSQSLCLKALDSYLDALRKKVKTNFLYEV